MAFQKGQPRPANAGRKPGSENKKKLQKLSDLLAESDLNPIKEVLKILQNSKDLSDRVKAELWLELYSYCEAKPKASEPLPETDDDADDFENVSNEQLLKLIKTPGNA